MDVGWPVAETRLARAPGRLIAEAALPHRFLVERVAVEAQFGSQTAARQRQRQGYSDVVSPIH